MSSIKDTDFSSLENAIGYEFNNKALLRRALTHSSHSNESGLKNHHIYCNERLEFLGDSVLSIIRATIFTVSSRNVPRASLQE